MTNFILSFTRAAWSDQATKEHLLYSLGRWGQSLVAPEAAQSGRGQFCAIFPAIAVSPDGTINVMWGDFRDDPVEASYHIYYTSSEDSGDSWGFNEELGLDVGNTRVTDYPTNPNKAFPQGLFIGDYFSIAATDEEAYMVWADGRLAEFGGTNQKIGFARKRQVAARMFLSPNAGPGGGDHRPRAWLPARSGILFAGEWFDRCHRAQQ